MNQWWVDQSRVFFAVPSHFRSQLEMWCRSRGVSWASLLFFFSLSAAFPRFQRHQGFLLLVIHEPKPIINNILTIWNPPNFHIIIIPYYKPLLTIMLTESSPLPGTTKISPVACKEWMNFHRQKEVKVTEADRILFERADTWLLLKRVRSAEAAWFFSLSPKIGA